MTAYNRQKTLVVTRHSTEALAIQENFVLLKGEVWRETNSTGYPTGRSKTGVDGQVVNSVIVGTRFVDLPFDPVASSALPTGGSPGDILMKNSYTNGIADWAATLDGGTFF